MVVSARRRRGIARGPRARRTTDHPEHVALGWRRAHRACRRPFARRRATRARVAPSGRRPDREEEPACGGAPRRRHSTSSLAAAGRRTRRTGQTSEVAQRGSIGLSRTSRYVSRGGWTSRWHARARLKRAPRFRRDSPLVRVDFRFRLHSLTRSRKAPGQKKNQSVKKKKEVPTGKPRGAVADAPAGAASVTHVRIYRGGKAHHVHPSVLGYSRQP